MMFIHDKTYSGKYTSIAETERAAENFLAFCSDRTELFVPAAGEDRFKFFHRSFFEYFYAQYIFLRIREVEEVYNSLQRFDVDSEIFELTLAMMKQKDEPRYQELMEYILGKLNEKIKEKNTNLSAFDILTLGMQVVDDNVYACKYVEYLVKNCENIVKNIENIPNQEIIYNVISDNDEFIQKIIIAYEDNAKLRIIETFLRQFSEMDPIINTKEFQEIVNKKNKRLFGHRIYIGFGNIFYVRLYFEKVNCCDILDNLSENDLEILMTKYKTTKKIRERYLKLYTKYKALDSKKQKILQELMLYSPVDGSSIRYTRR